VLDDVSKHAVGSERNPDCCMVYRGCRGAVYMLVELVRCYCSLPFNHRRKEVHWMADTCANASSLTHPLHHTCNHAAMPAYCYLPGGFDEYGQSKRGCTG